MEKKCEVCSEAPARYRCPRCLVETCSLPCVKKHKERDDCDGQRDRTAYIPLDKFTELDLLSDYRFLEEADRRSENSSRDQIKHSADAKKWPLFIKRLVEEAKRRRVKLLLMPSLSTKRNANTSRYVHSGKEITWHVQLNFLSAEAQYEITVSEKLAVKNILKRYIHPSQSEPVIRQRLGAFVKQWPHVHVFMKAEKHPNNAPRYHEFALSETLERNLRNKVVIEYPALYVALEDEKDQYNTQVNDCTKEVEDWCTGVQHHQEPSGAKRSGKTTRFRRTKAQKEARHNKDNSMARAQKDWHQGKDQSETDQSFTDASFTDQSFSDQSFQDSPRAMICPGHQDIEHHVERDTRNLQVKRLGTQGEQQRSAFRHQWAARGGPARGRGGFGHQRGRGRGFGNQGGRGRGFGNQGGRGRGFGNQGGRGFAPMPNFH